MPETVIDPVRQGVASEGMRIAQVAPLFERVPPHQYGGTERVVSYLTEELVARGHAVTLFASGDSITRARLLAGCERSLRLHAASVDPVAIHLGMLARVYERAKDFDVVHCHIDYLTLPFTRGIGVPTVLRQTIRRYPLRLFPRHSTSSRSASIKRAFDGSPLAAS